MSLNGFVWILLMGMNLNEVYEVWIIWSMKEIYYYYYIIIIHGSNTHI